jgi:hypothetical protein
MEAIILLVIFWFIWKAFKGWLKLGESCPKCDSKNIKTVKPNFLKKYWIEPSMNLFTLGLRKPTRDLHVCRDCGFSWEAR